MAGALLTWFAGAAGLRVGRVVAAASSWAALAALVGLWAPSRSPIEYQGIGLGPGLQFGQSLDAVGFALALALLLPGSLLLTFQHRGWEAAGAAALSLTFSLTAVLANSLVITALGLGTAASVMLVQVRSDGEVGIRSFWPFQVAGWLILLWAAATLQALTGTSAFAAVPVAAVREPIFVLMAAGALLSSAALPWRGWTSEFWDRPRLASGTLAIATLLPVSFLVLFRTYEIGGGRWPSPLLNVALAVAGAAAVIGAAFRAQAASVRRSVAGETVPGLCGFALVGLALATPLGLVAAVACVLAAGVVSALLPLVPEDRSATSLTASLLAAGLPPSIAFAARLLTVQAGIEAGTGPGFLVIGLALAWLIGLAAAARGARLAPGSAGSVRAGSLPGSLAGLALLLAGGAGFGLVTSALCIPAASELVPQPVNSVGGPPLAVLSASGGWAAAALGVPVVALALILMPVLRAGVLPAARGAVEPFFETDWTAAPRRWYERLARIRVPKDYESLFNPRALEAAMARGQPVLWAVLLLVLAIAVNR
jgi:hypothetical protein